MWKRYGLAKTGRLHFEYSDENILHFGWVSLGNSGQAVLTKGEGRLVYIMEMKICLTSLCCCKGRFLMTSI